MKKNLALLLVVAIVFTCLLGFSASAADYYTVSMVTVPMRATISVLFAVEVKTGDVNNKVDGENHPGISIYKDGGIRDSNYEYKGILEMDGKQYWVYEYSNIAASEMEVDIRAKVPSTPDNLSIHVTVADYLRAYAGNTENDANYIDLANKMLAYGEKAAAWAAAQ